MVRAEPLNNTALTPALSQWEREKSNCETGSRDGGTFWIPSSPPAALAAEGLCAW